MDLQVSQEVFIVDRYGNRKDRIKQIGRKYVHAEFNGSYIMREHFPLEGEWGYEGELYLSREHYEEVKAQNLKINDLKFEIEKEIRGYHSVETLEKILKILKDEEANKGKLNMNAKDFFTLVEQMRR